MDTVTLIRSAIRGLLKVADVDLEAQLRAVVSGVDDYAAAGKPVCDWNDAQARMAVVDRLATDGLAALQVLDGRTLPDRVAQAAELVAVVIGQDLDQGDDGLWRIVRGVATDRVISTVDPDARHGRKSSSGKFDGFKGHVAVDPDTEIITDTAVGPANAGDGALTGRLTRDLDHHDNEGDHHGGDGAGSDGGGPAIYGDAAYGSGDNLADLAARRIVPMVKVQPPSPRGGRFTKNDFTIDVDHQTVTCPQGHTSTIQRSSDGAGTACFGDHCRDCPLRDGCTTAKRGRTVSVHRHETLLAHQRQRQQHPDWQADYRATRPKVERKLAHLIRRGRRARRRGLDRVDADWNLLASAINLARMATLGVNVTRQSWQPAPA